jgi:hypothetical protein
MSEPERADPPAAPKTLGQVFSQMTLDTAAILGGAALMAIGSVGPWATSPLASASGTTGDGVITLIAALVIAALAIFTSGWRMLGVLIVIAGAIGIYDLIHESNKYSSIKLAGVQIDHVGWGLYVVVVGAVVALVGLYKRPRAPII